MSIRWFSKFGFILPNSRDTQSENGVLFSVELAFLRQKVMDRKKHKFSIALEMDRRHLTSLIRSLWETNGGDYRTTPNDLNDRFSLDNMKAVAAYSRKNIKSGSKNKENLKKLKIFRHYSLRPDSLAFLVYCRWPLVGFWFLWIVSLSMFLTCLKSKFESSGKNLAFVQAYGANMRITWWICELLLGDLTTQWQVYFPEKDHPINIEARALWPK